MIDKAAFSRVHVLVPNTRFLDYQDRRRRIAAELMRRTMLEDAAALTNGEVAIVKDKAAAETEMKEKVPDHTGDVRR